ncbi:peptide ABC transporter substrate-binding protein [Aurantiacibacter xanthus]|uniref:Peptide ABC transporter substrate-binding protein n=1 Tax=Aurantiacibacter xanthus TaxID=1784712 RepID=A0A3A1PBE9_9SPHN|nr:ABC transporter substrate-binding protein [Aurantiacibacter xanthus]RIV90868.1 peptide ABC transporter substrate-binding protein [Aurantiacibacter xanthus]
MLAPFQRTLRPLTCAFALALAGCGQGSDGEFTVAWIGTEQDLQADGVRLSNGGQLVRAATESGLVALDARGEVVPALAERWIVTDDGLSFIFRLREDEWADGSEMSAESVREALRRNLRALRGTSLGLDLSPIDEIRAMTGRVVEIRLTTPVPELLTLLAQPELVLREEGNGPMTLERIEPRPSQRDEVSAAQLLFRFKPPAERGLPDAPEWQDGVRDLLLVPAPARRALKMFDDGDANIVLGGRIDHLPLVDIGPLSRGTLQIDPAIGLFGLRVREAKGVLEEPALREAIAMAIDRPAVMEPFNVAGWSASTRLVAPDLPGDPGLVGERWADQSLEQRRQTAAARVQQYLARQEGATPAAVRLSLAIGEGPGLNRLLKSLADQLAAVNVRLERADDPATADLVLVDRVARFSDPRWFLDQFACSLRQGLCSQQADSFVVQSMNALDPVVRASLIAQAELQLTRDNVYIPIGAPIRWSLVRSGTRGFSPNRYAFHPLPPMAEVPK